MMQTQLVNTGDYGRGSQNRVLQGLHVTSPEQASVGLAGLSLLGPMIPAVGTMLGGPGVGALLQPIGQIGAQLLDYGNRANAAAGLSQNLETGLTALKNVQITERMNPLFMASNPRKDMISELIQASKDTNTEIAKRNQELTQLARSRQMDETSVERMKQDTESSMRVQGRDTQRSILDIGRDKMNQWITNIALTQQDINRQNMQREYAIATAAVQGLFGQPISVAEFASNMAAVNELYASAADRKERWDEARLEAHTRRYEAGMQLAGSAIGGGMSAVGNVTGSVIQGNAMKSAAGTMASAGQNTGPYASTGGRP